MATQFVQTSYKTKADTVQKLSVTSTGAILSTQISDWVGPLRLVGEIPVWITFGSSTVVASSTGANSIYLPANLVEYKNFDKNSYVSVLADSTSGTFTLSEETQ